MLPETFKMSDAGMERVRDAWARNAAARDSAERALALEIAEARRANPWLLKSRNLSRQCLLTKHDPELASRFKEEARLAQIAGRV